ncbi:hypothetical protein LJB99_01435 [Deltaproteobacteria bacterium OttesenSCG-928-K17]|nr:hypothetical protein [Deltaproteobacteria bacterium OttesenSCG-928-K17]
MDIVKFILLETVPCSLLFIAAVVIMLGAYSGNTKVTRPLSFSVVLFMFTGLLIGSCMFSIGVGEASDFIKEVAVPVLFDLLLVNPILTFIIYIIYIAHTRKHAQPTPTNGRQKAATVAKALGASLLGISALGFFMQLWLIR